MRLAILAVCMGIFFAGDYFWFRGEYTRELWVILVTLATDARIWVEDTLARLFSR